MASIKSALVFVLALAILCDLYAAQTFHYSHGWTNGKKRTFWPSSMPTADADRPEAIEATLQEHSRKIGPREVVDAQTDLLDLHPVHVSKALVLTPVVVNGQRVYKLYTTGDDDEDKDARMM